MADDIIGFFNKRNFKLYIAKTGERFDSVKCSEYTRRLKGLRHIDICAMRESYS